MACGAKGNAPRGGELTPGYALEALTGKHIKIRIPEKTADKMEAVDLPSSNEQTSSAQAEQPERQGWGLIYESHESYQETEKISFAAEGIIKTVDGKEINFETQLNMSRQFITENHISIRAGDGFIVDPLVINYASGQKMKMEMIISLL